jgi:hypothetical protein
MPMDANRNTVRHNMFPHPSCLSKRGTQPIIGTRETLLKIDSVVIVIIVMISEGLRTKMTEERKRREEHHHLLPTHHRHHQYQTQTENICYHPHYHSKPFLFLLSLSSQYHHQMCFQNRIKFFLLQLCVFFKHVK